MGQMCDTTCNHMNNWRWNNTRAFRDHSNSQTTSSGVIKGTGKRFSWYGSDDSRGKIEPPTCRQYKPGDFLVVRPLSSHGMINKDGDNENWADPGAPSCGQSRPGDGKDNNDRKG